MICLSFIRKLPDCEISGFLDLRKTIEDEFAEATVEIWYLTVLQLRK